MKKRSLPMGGWIPGLGLLLAVTLFYGLGADSPTTNRAKGVASSPIALKTDRAPQSDPNLSVVKVSNSSSQKFTKDSGKSSGASNGGTTGISTVEIGAVKHFPCFALNDKNSSDVSQWWGQRGSHFKVDLQREVLVFENSSGEQIRYLGEWDAQGKVRTKKFSYDQQGYPIFLGDSELSPSVFARTQDKKGFQRVSRERTLEVQGDQISGRVVVVGDEVKEVELIGDQDQQVGHCIGRRCSCLQI